MAPIKPPLIVIPEVDGWQGWVVLGLVGFMLFALVAELAPPHVAMMGTLLTCLALSIITIKEAFQGFSDEAMLSVAVLFVVAKGIEMSGGLEYVASVLFKAPNKSKPLRLGSTPSRTEGSIVWVLLKFCVPVAIFSAFLANIPLVAMMIPPILEFGNKVKVAPSKMLLPLSYAATLGGTMTLIGASTNLMVLSMAAQKLPDLHMSLFEIGLVGLPTTIAGIFYIIVFSAKLLPDRVSEHSAAVNPRSRDYNIVVAIKQTSKFANKSIAWSGLGRQPGLNLVAITRDMEIISNPTPEVVLQPNDKLHFVGVIDSVLLLVQLKGLKLTEDEGQGEVDLNQLKPAYILVEAVIAQGSSMVHERVADLQCRTRFNATIAAIHRHGQHLTSLIGDIRVEAGDCLLMVTNTPDFVAKHRNNSHFALVSQLPGFKPINRKKAAIASVLVVAMVVASGFGVDLLLCALLSSAGLLLTRCLTPQDAMEAIELPVVIMIAAAFGIAEAMVESGAATILAKALMGLAGKSMFGLISCTYIATTLFSLAITNSAAVTIMFPVALAAASHQALDFRPFAYTLMMAASAGFMTPTACPTNLMVYGPGSYKFSDYIHYGGPLQVWLLFVTVGVTMSPKYWYVWAVVIFVLTCAATPLIASHKSTHPSPTTGIIGAQDTKSLGGRHDEENPSTLMLAPGHDNEETITRRISQSTVQPTTSTSSMATFPSTFPSPFPLPYRLEDSSSTSSSGTRTSQTTGELSSVTFPPPYRLDESPIPTFPSIRTSLSGKAAQLIIYNPKPMESDPLASSSSGLTIARAAEEDAPPPPLSAGLLLSPSAQQQSSQTPPTSLIPKIVPFGIPVAALGSQPKPDIGPFRTRQSLVQRLSSPPGPPEPPSQPVGMSSEAISSSSSLGLSQPQLVGGFPEAAFSSSSAGVLQKPLEVNVDDSFTDVSISEGEHSSSSSIGQSSSNGPVPIPTTNDGGGSSESLAPMRLLPTVLRTSFSSILNNSGGVVPSNKPTSGDASSSVAPVAGAAGDRPSKHVSTDPRLPEQSRKSSRASSARKKSKSPRSGRGPVRASRNASKKASPNIEEDLTGGISNLLTSRRLSSLSDTSAFADNVGVVDH